MTTATTTKSPFLTTDEVAAMLHLKRNTLEHLRLRGCGPKYLKNGPGIRARVLYRHEDVLSYLNEQQSTSENVPA